MSKKILVQWVQGMTIFLLLAVTPISSAIAARAGIAGKRKAVPVLWQEPFDIETRDLALGPGGETMFPDLRELTLIKQETGGHSLKYRVRDGAGQEWVAKIGDEAQSETAAVRLLWAVGYVTEVSYLVPKIYITGLNQTFENVRLEARPKNVKRKGQWHWINNPFTGTRELQGLKVMMALLNNWDTKDSNNHILVARNLETGEKTRQYVISDLGATLGKSSGPPLFWRMARSRNVPEDFANARFIDGVRNGLLHFHYQGKNNPSFQDIPLKDVQWISGLLSRLSDQQIQDAFLSANYSRPQIRLLTATILQRIHDLCAVSSCGKKAVQPMP